MTTDNGPSTTAPDPKTITKQLRREILDLEDDPEELPDTTDDEQWTYRHFADVPVNYSPSVTAAVDGVIRSRPLGDSGRVVALAGVEKQLTHRRSMDGLLPVFLRAVREQRALDITTLALQADIGVADLRDLERGAKPVSRHFLPAETVAKWIRPLDPPRQTVISALRRSLAATATDQPSLAAGATLEPKTDDEYIATVLALLDQTDQRDEK